VDRRFSWPPASRLLLPFRCTIVRTRALTPPEPPFSHPKTSTSAYRKRSVTVEAFSDVVLVPGAYNHYPLFPEVILLPDPSFLFIIWEGSLLRVKLFSVGDQVRMSVRFGVLMAALGCRSPYSVAGEPFSLHGRSIFLISDYSPRRES